MCGRQPLLEIETRAVIGFNPGMGYVQVRIPTDTGQTRGASTAIALDTSLATDHWAIHLSDQSGQEN